MAIPSHPNENIAYIYQQSAACCKHSSWKNRLQLLCIPPQTDLVMYEDNDLGNLTFSLDVVCTIAAFLFAFWARDFFFPVGTTLNLSSHVFLLPLIIVLVTSFLTYFGGYRAPRKISYVDYSWAIIRAMVVTFSVTLALLFFLEIKYISRFVILIFAIIEYFALMGVRAYIILHYKSQTKSGKRKLKVLIIGSQGRAKALVAALKQQLDEDIEIVGFLDPDQERKGKIISGIPVIGTVENTSECLKNNVVDEVIIAITRSMLKDAEPIVMACEEEGIRLCFMADVFNVQVARVSLTTVKGIPLLNMEPVAQNPQQLFAKRIFDLVLTTLAIPLLLPLFAIIAIAIKIDSPGPVFFVQQRVGLRKNVFPMYKFRSMYIDAEERLNDLEHLNEAEGPIFKIKNDPRITKVGRFLRKTSLDELPQLINVFKGEMSLVGPRPMSTRDVDLFDRGIQRKRFSVQPGLTCLWQISGRSDLPFEKWLELDLEYIENWSFWLDLKILYKTVPAVLFTKGAL